MGIYSGSVYVYTKIDGKWTKDVKIDPDNEAAEDSFWYSVAILGGTALYGLPSGRHPSGG